MYYDRLISTQKDFCCRLVIGWEAVSEVITHSRRVIPQTKNRFKLINNCEACELCVLIFEINWLMSYSRRELELERARENFLAAE